MMLRSPRGWAVIVVSAAMTWLGAVLLGPVASGETLRPAAVIGHADRSAEDLATRARRTSERALPVAKAWGRCLRGYGRATVRLVREGQWRRPGACGGERWRDRRRQRWPQGSA